MLKSSDYPALEALAAIAETGSFDGAAARLGVTTGAVSQRIKGLEDRLGTVLVRRINPAEPTAQGARLVRHFGEVRALEAGLGPGGQPGLLRVAINADSLAAWALPAFAAVPDVLFDIEIDDQDHSDTWLRDGAVSAAVTSRETPVRGCDVIPLGALAYAVVAAPGFAATWFPEGITAEALSKAPALTFNRKDELQRRWAREQVGRDIILPTHYLPSTNEITQAIRLGLGWGLNPASTLAEDIAAGRLVRLSETPLPIPLYWQVARLSAPAVAPLTEALRQVARDALNPI